MPVENNWSILLGRLSPRLHIIDCRQRSGNALSTGISVILSRTRCEILFIVGIAFISKISSISCRVSYGIFWLAGSLQEMLKLIFVYHHHQRVNTIRIMKRYTASKLKPDVIPFKLLWIWLYIQLLFKKKNLKFFICLNKTVCKE